MEQHLRDSHDTTLTEAARDYEAIKKPDTNEFFEHALVKIANSGSHDDAVEIATAALLGEDL